MLYPAAAIANYFIGRASADGKRLTPMKLQKLVYYAHGWNLAITNQALIDEQIEAWKFGPVIRSLYTELAKYGNRPITNKIEKFAVSAAEPGGARKLRHYVPEVDCADVNTTAVRALLDRVWEIYGGYTAVQLSNMTHAAQTPWEQTARKYEGNLPRGTDIPTETIRSHFAEMAAH